MALSLTRPAYRAIALVLFVLALGACARITHGPLVAPFGPPVTAPSRLRVVVFELRGLDVPFHSGVIIHHAGETLIFDPAGWWEQRHNDFDREGQVIVNVTRAVEASYLARAGIRYSVGGWVTHVFDIPVSAEVAQQAMTLARHAPPVAAFRCAQATGELLSRLPGFAQISPHWITADLYHALLSHPGVTYSRYDLAGAQSG